MADSIKLPENTNKQEILSGESIEENKQISGGFIRYYGLYWDRNFVFWNENQMLAVPIGKTGQGKRPKNAADNWNCINFWGQKGVYILYDAEMYPIYAGQVGIERKNTKVGNDIGGRLTAHRYGKYRNAWRFFSWFGFLERELERKSVRSIDVDRQIRPKWIEVKDHKSDLNSLLASFEAIIIEGFIPRLNARGGDMKDAVRCDQYEGNGILTIEQ
ncbi:hypothetical protein [Oceaniradius stylonematis]|uniref:hypothetical protein n=1 Tax=Oceaniradius stylonematis TaxID=2184161 RepID=UPI0026D388C5